MAFGEVACSYYYNEIITLDNWLYYLSQKDTIPFGALLPQSKCRQWGGNRPFTVLNM